MTRSADGAWTTGLSTSTALNARYLYEVKVWAPTTGKVETNVVTDPRLGRVDRELDPLRRGRPHEPGPHAVGVEPHPVTEGSPRTSTRRSTSLHVRDYSMSDAKVPAALRGAYLAFAADGDGRAHLKALAKAGLNTVHLLPAFDIASIEEDKAKQQTPQCDLASYAPDSEEQQKCVGAVAAKDAFNWGYDPYHYSVPDGSYASSTAAADGGARVAEFRTMVGALHQDGLRVVLDQVFNHTAQSGQAEKSVLDKVVPGYYHRLNASGAVETSTCCQNVATEHAMGQKPWSTPSCRGPATTGSTASASTSWATTARPTCWRCARPSTP